MTDDLTLAEAARRTGISRRTLGRLIADGALTGHRTDRGWRIPVDALDDIKTRTTSTSTSTSTADEIAVLRNEITALRDRAETAEANVAAVNDVAAELRIAAAVAEARAAERTEMIDRLNERAEATDQRLADALDALTAAHADLRQALAITGAVTGALTTNRPDALDAVDYADAKPRRRWRRRK